MSKRRIPSFQHLDLGFVADLRGLLQNLDEFSDVDARKQAERLRDRADRLVQAARELYAEARAARDYAATAPAAPIGAPAGHLLLGPIARQLLAAFTGRLRRRRRRPGSTGQPE